MLVARTLDSVIQSQWGNHEIHETHERIAIRKRHRSRATQLIAADLDFNHEHGIGCFRSWNVHQQVISSGDHESGTQ
jgi:hypothetical protein